MEQAVLIPWLSLSPRHADDGPRIDASRIQDLNSVAIRGSRVVNPKRLLNVPGRRDVRKCI